MPNPDPPDAQTLRRAILARAASAAPGASFCPSEVASALSDDWRPLMPAIREAAAKLADQGLLIATQRGTPVDPRTARGPIRLRPV